MKVEEVIHEAKAAKTPRGDAVAVLLESGFHEAVIAFFKKGNAANMDTPVLIETLIKLSITECYMRLNHRADKMMKVVGAAAMTKMIEELAEQGAVTFIRGDGK